MAKNLSTQSDSAGTQSSLRAGTPKNKRLAGAIIVALFTGWVTARFFVSAHDTIAATRENACRALEPSPLPQAVANGLPADFKLPDATGKMWSLADLKGRPVLLNFWATWCPPCVEEMPALETLAEQLGNDAVVLAVSVDDDWDAVRRFFPKGTPISVVWDESKTVPKSFGTDKYPESFLVDASGKLRHYFVNKRKWDSGEARDCILGAR
ncbi:MAG: TlpA family protein disulfide reductase [Myxococcales bacterium]|nr:TlpA family protein disulfide reductase [Myxococcales bacterium]